mmetsp:Transcript_1400/g.4574  ORF Transcript_1400/g.4574 Transcript_1400/m.4574 type:complete len:878 (+) Transcript_1400:1096-3729(+)
MLRDETSRLEGRILSRVSAALAEERGSIESLFKRGEAREAAGAAAARAAADAAADAREAVLKLSVQLKADHRASLKAIQAGQTTAATSGSSMSEVDARADAQRVKGELRILKDDVTKLRASLRNSDAARKTAEGAKREAENSRRVAEGEVAAARETEKSARVDLERAHIDLARLRSQLTKLRDEAQRASAIGAAEAASARDEARAEVRAAREEARLEIAATREEAKAEIATIRQETKRDVAAARAAAQGEVAALQRRLQEAEAARDALIESSQRQAHSQNVLVGFAAELEAAIAPAFSFRAAATALSQQVSALITMSETLTRHKDDAVKATEEATSQLRHVRKLVSTAAEESKREMEARALKAESEVADLKQALAFSQTSVHAELSSALIAANSLSSTLASHLDSITAAAVRDEERRAATAKKDAAAAERRAAAAERDETTAQILRRENAEARETFHRATGRLDDAINRIGEAIAARADVDIVARCKEIDVARSILLVDLKAEVEVVMTSVKEGFSAAGRAAWQRDAAVVALGSALREAEIEARQQREAWSNERQAWIAERAGLIDQCNTSRKESERLHAADVAEAVAKARSEAEERAALLVEAAELRAAKAAETADDARRALEEERGLRNVQLAALEKGMEAANNAVASATAEAAAARQAFREAADSRVAVDVQNTELLRALVSEVRASRVAAERAETVSEAKLRRAMKSVEGERSNSDGVYSTETRVATERERVQGETLRAVLREQGNALRAEREAAQKEREAVRARAEGAERALEVERAASRAIAMRGEVGAQAQFAATIHEWGALRARQESLGRSLDSLSRLSPYCEASAHKSTGSPYSPSVRTFAASPHGSPPVNALDVEHRRSSPTPDIST